MASTRISGIRKNKDGTFTESASRASSDSYKPNTADANASATNPTATGYKPSAAVNSAKQAYTVHNSKKPSAYTGKYDKLINDNLNNILNRKQFSYDANKDALYNQYKDMYTRNGQTAMQDTMGNAALLTGGYGNSYATTAGQQAYNSYMQQLNDKIPELEQRAYERYRDETNDLYNQNNLLTNLDSTDYSRYRDKMSDYLNDRDFYYNAYNNERNFDYGKYRDDAGDAKDDRNFNYQKERDSVSDDQWQKTFNYNQYRDKVGDDQWQKQFDYQKQRDAVSDAQWEKNYNYNVSKDLQKAIAAAQEETDEDTAFDPDKAYKFLTDYEDYFGTTATPNEIAESMFQLYGNKDGFWDWADQATLGDKKLSDVIYALHPDDEHYGEELAEKKNQQIQEEEKSKYDSGAKAMRNLYVKYGQDAVDEAISKTKETGESLENYLRNKYGK